MGKTSPHVPISSGGPAQVKQEVGKVNCSHKFQWTICQQQFLSVEIVRTKEKGESGHVISHGFTKAPGICSVLRSATDLKEYSSNRKFRWKSVRNREPSKLLIFFRKNTKDKCSYDVLYRNSNSAVRISFSLVRKSFSFPRVLLLFCL